MYKPALSRRARERRAAATNRELGPLCHVQTMVVKKCWSPDWLTALGPAFFVDQGNIGKQRVMILRLWQSNTALRSPHLWESLDRDPVRQRRSSTTVFTNPFNKMPPHLRKGKEVEFGHTGEIVRVHAGEAELQRFLRAGDIERSKEAVPDGEHKAIVLIVVIGILTVMNLMLRRAYEYPAEYGTI